MLAAWLKTLRSGLSRRGAKDRVGGADQESRLRDSLARIAPYLRRHRGLALAGGAFVGASTLTGLAPPLVTRFLVDEVILGRQADLLAAATGMLVACLAAEKLFNLAEEYCFSRYERRVLFDIHKDLLSRALKFPKAFFDEQQSGYLTRRLTEDVEGLRFLFSRTMAHAVGSGLRLVGGIVLLIYLEWRIALATLLLLPVLVVVLRYFSGKVYALSRERLENQAEVSGSIQESLSDTVSLKAFASETRARNRIMGRVKRGLTLGLEQSLVGSVCSTLVQSAPGIGRAAVLAAGAVLIVRGQWTMGSLIAFQAYMGQVFGPVQFLSSVSLQFQRARAALGRVSDIFDIVAEDAQSGRFRVKELTGDIEFRNVSFAYSASNDVLINRSFHIRAGEAVAIMGASGIGKTTLLSLLLGFYRPTAGEIYFDGRPVADYELKSLRRRLGYVPQKPKLVSGSIMENLRYGSSMADADDVFQAARAAGVHEAILAFPAGYQTQVGEGGAILSEGERQRLALARALVAGPDILILDEPTASLDSPAEKLMLESLLSNFGGRTIIIVTHRHSTAKICDRVLRFDADRLSEFSLQRFPDSVTTPCDQLSRQEPSLNRNSERIPRSLRQG